jgi:4-amino-4-deoxy-L-arabinose transferase-like glycosyltransferase
MDRPYFKLAGFAVLLGLLLIRFLWLDNDPPLYFIGHGQSLLTDPYHLTFAARNSILYGDWNPFDFFRWDIFKYSLISGVSYLFFSVAGVSRTVANLAALLLQTGGFLLFLLGLLRSYDRKEASLAAFLLLLNSTLFFYGRVPFLENGLIFLSGLMFFVFVRFHDQLWGQVITGGLVALAALSGKLFGLCMLGPVVLTLLYRYRTRAMVPILATVAGLVVGAAIYLMTFFQGSLSRLTDYYTEQTVGMYGTPPAFVSVSNFFSMLVTYGGESGLWEYIPFLALLTALCLIVLLLTTPNLTTFARENMPLIFCVAWLLCGVFALMPFSHRPLRYGLFLFLPASAICAYVLRAVSLQKVKLSLGNKWVVLPLIFLILWHTLTQIFISFSTKEQKFGAGIDAMFYAVIISLLIIFTVYLWLRTGRKILHRNVLIVPLGLLFLSAIVYQGKHISEGLSGPGAYLKKYDRELSQLLHKDATLTGPYMPALTVDNELKGVIYMFGLTNVQRDLFETYPVSHIVADRTNWLQAVKDFPFLKASTKILEMVIRERVIELYRVPNQHIPYTDFETGVTYLAKGKPDSALVYLTRFNESYPDNLFGNMHLALALYVTRNQKQADIRLRELTAKHHDNYLLHAFCGELFRKLYKLTNDADYLTQSKHHKDRAKQLNPVVRGSS